MSGGACRCRRPGLAPAEAASRTLASRVSVRTAAPGGRAPGAEPWPKPGGSPAGGKRRPALPADEASSELLRQGW